MINVLVVDDVSSWRNFHYKILKNLYGEDVIIDMADSATSAYEKVLENNIQPYDAILTDLQMECDYAPKYAGEWLVEQVKLLPKYYKTRIIIISSSSAIRIIAKNLGVDCLPKSQSLSEDQYKSFLEC